MKSIRTAILALALLALGLGSLYGQSRLNMFLEYNRFLDNNKNTIVHIDYQIPYQNLEFKPLGGGFFAEVTVLVDIMESDTLFFQQTITDNIGISDITDSASDKSYLNRLSFLLEKPIYDFRFRAEDRNSTKKFSWDFRVEALPKASLISDVELSSEVRPDSTSFLTKFHRGNTLYRTEPSLIFNKSQLPYTHLFFEVYAPKEAVNSSQLMVLTIEKDSVIVKDDFIDYTPMSGKEGLSLKIPLADLAAGKYTGTVELQIDGRNETVFFEFFVSEVTEQIYFLFTDPEDDILLLRYFSGNQIPSDWTSYDQLTKRRYVSQTWKTMARKNGLRTEDTISMIRERVDYANRFFKHFKDGWRTDIGRIYIRHGKPDEVDKDTTMDDTRFVRKDYQIWKYRGKVNAVYVFVDIQMNGNYQLVYVNNDDMERSYPDYLRYLGDDFDTSALQN